LVSVPITHAYAHVATIWRTYDDVTHAPTVTRIDHSLAHVVTVWRTHYTATYATPIKITGDIGAVSRTYHYLTRCLTF
jgi:hypothetical protein